MSAELQEQHLVGRAHCRGGQRLQGRHGDWHTLHDGLKQAVVVQGCLTLAADLLHDLQGVIGYTSVLWRVHSP